MKTGPFFTVKEACAATRLSKTKLYELISKGLLRRVQLPGCKKVLIAHEELERFVDAGVQAGAVPACA